MFLGPPGRKCASLAVRLDRLALRGGWIAWVRESGGHDVPSRLLKTSKTAGYSVATT